MLNVSSEYIVYDWWYMYCIVSSRRLIPVLFCSGRTKLHQWCVLLCIWGMLALLADVYREIFINIAENCFSDFRIYWYNFFGFNIHRKQKKLRTKAIMPVYCLIDSKERKCYRPPKCKWTRLKPVLLYIHFFSCYTKLAKIKCVTFLFASIIFTNNFSK